MNDNGMVKLVQLIGNGMEGFGKINYSLVMSCLHIYEI
ncbi:hypothetical protein LINGRAHAP2_LOCUS22677 [Linum grandiflorum]